MRQRNIISTKATLISSIISIAIATTITIVAMFREPSSKIILHDTHHNNMRRLTTGIKIRIPPSELIEYINNLEPIDQHKNDGNKKIMMDEDQQQQTSFKISATILSYDGQGQESSIGVITIENNLRGHGIISIKIENISQCSTECTFMIRSRTTGINTCNRGILPNSSSANHDILFKLSSNENSDIDKQIHIKIGPTDDYSNHLIFVVDENSSPIACGIFASMKEMTINDTTNNQNIVNVIDKEYGDFIQQNELHYGNSTINDDGP